MTLLEAVELSAAGLGIDIDDPGEHAALLALCRHLARRIDADEAGQDGPTELRRALNDLRRQAREDHDAGDGAGVIERLRAV